jgi:WD40-like Beta Propeller Repeat
VADADGSGRRALTPPGSYDCMWMAWSPRGTQIVVTRNSGCEGVIDVSVVNADGSRRRTIARSGWDAVWTPDGRRILYARDSFYVVGADGEGGGAFRGPGRLPGTDTRAGRGRPGHEMEGSSSTSATPRSPTHEACSSWPIGTEAGFAA